MLGLKTFKSIKAISGIYWAYDENGDLIKVHLSEQSKGKIITQLGGK